MFKVVCVVGCGFLLVLSALSTIVAAERDFPDECYKSQISYVSCLKRKLPPPLELDPMMQPDVENDESSDVAFQRHKAAPKKPATKAGPKPTKPTSQSTKPTTAAPKPTFGPVNTKFPSRGGLKWLPTWGPQISLDEYKIHRSIIQEAMNIWSSLIEDAITVRVCVDADKFSGLFQGFAVSKDVSMNIGTYAKLNLEPKLGHNGYQSVKFPDPPAMVNLMKPPQGWSNPQNQILSTNAEMKALRSDMHTVIDKSDRFDGNFTIDNKDGAFVQWELDLAKMVSPTGKDSLLWVALHELGHILGFRSVVDEVDAEFIEKNEFKPRPLDLYRFRGDQTVNWMTTNRVLEPSRSVPHVWADPLPIDGRLPTPKFARGFNNGDFYQASHWDVPDQTILFPGLMTANNGEADLPSGFTLPDLRAFSRLGYKINMFAKPRLYNVWKKSFASGTYFGVVAYLLVSPNIEFMFKASDGSQCLIRSRSPTYMSRQEANTDLGSFLVRRKNLFTAFRMNLNDRLPILKPGVKWTLSARNWSDILGKSGEWSDPIQIPAEWTQFPTAGDYQTETSFDQSRGRLPSFVACSASLSTKPGGGPAEAQLLQ